ncbi:EsaB/YukD family protein [Chloroflexota bacterium]
MGRVRVSLVNHVRGTKTQVELPDDVPVEKLMHALVQRLGLPSQEGGNPIIYRLDNRETRETIYGKITLADTGVTDGTILTLFRVIPNDTEVKRELLRQHKRNLDKLRLQAAKYGSFETPLHIQNQIEDEENKIAEIEAELSRPTSSQAL